MKKIALILLCLVSLDSIAKIWIVDSNVGSTVKDFTTLQTAHDGAIAGDTLYLIGSPNNYLSAKINVTKKLVIIGPGFFLTENPDTQANTLSAFMNSTVPFQCTSIEFAVGSEGSVMMGMEVRGGIKFTANNILVKRNKFQEFSCGSSMVDITASNIIFIQNYVQGTNSNGVPLLIVNGNQSNVVIANNFLYQLLAHNGGNPPAISALTSSVEISNNILRGSLSVANGLVQNNVFIFNNAFTATTSIVRNNYHVGASLPGGNSNVNNIVLANFFAGSTTDGLWQLKAGSLGIGGGFGGGDAGMFGGVEPYVLSGIPPVPAIYSFTAPVVGDKVLGLPVQIKVKSRN